MRQLVREKRGLWFAPYESKEQILDEYGLMTGEWKVRYGKPIFLAATVSPRSGNSWGDGFGLNVDCDRTALADKIGTGIDETCIAWIDVRPALNNDGTLELDADGLMAVPNDYVVVMVGESYNFTSIALKKAD